MKQGHGRLWPNRLWPALVFFSGMADFGQTDFGQTDFDLCFCVFVCVCGVAWVLVSRFRFGHVSVPQEPPFPGPPFPRLPPSPGPPKISRFFSLLPEISFFLPSLKVSS